MIRTFATAVAFLKVNTASITNSLSHNCKAQPGGFVETYKSNCEWVLNWLEGVPNDHCQLENAGNHTTAEIDDYMLEWEDRCCASGLCPNQRKLSYFPIFEGYGCWCSASTLFKFGRGQAMDELDEKCKNLVENYRCIDYDTKNENGDCPADFNDYHVPFNMFIPEEELLQKCTAVQDQSLSDEHTTCSIRRCQVDHTVLSFMLNSFGTGYQTNPELVWTEFGGPFDPAVNCVAPPPSDADRTCCGDYPYRLPHNGNKIGCCAGQKYGLDSQECCDSGVVHQVTDINSCAGTTVPWDFA